MRILFANENTIYSSFRVRKLRELGFEVIFRQNAAQVFEAFEGPRESWPDILVMDNFLPSGETELVTEHSTYGYIRTGTAIYGVLRERQITTPVLIYTSERIGHEDLKELCVNDSRLAEVYGCADDSTSQIMAAVQKLAELVGAKVAPASAS